ncbi:MAG: hypothetical protein IM550_01400 [Microcystis sp. M54BS1]|uniref:hypothetical protein n=1 Tax=unclassified Microcystis TaxID=2643300 RepID=UPI001E0B8E55|nr:MULTISPECIES: hypothetical protein [unclassified Microcystis]MCA2537936.1 hypothetical protein [Microcystis sp. M54BS1]MCA2594849.1 hypothetical protein [Microcystis sp. M38BS1]MCA2609493.1 hypothetical protein [Microcystis sp. M27BS1]NCR55387.1 hypothetical protein [Microcystis aeruginosa L211-07]MCA2504815.1 hypothetical protein [Microcystis sp. M62BS1]
MNQTCDLDDDLRPEYDFTKLPVIARGQGRKKTTLTVEIDPDVATIFPDSAAVNEGLRLLLRLIQNSSPQVIEQSLTTSKTS